MHILNSIIFFGAPRSEVTSETLKNRVNIERTKIYFQHTKMALVSIFLGLSIGVVLLALFKVSWLYITTWGGALCAFGITLFRYEYFVKKQLFTPEVIASFISKRLIITFCIALVWGLFIQLIPDSSKLGYTLSYIAMSTFIHIGFLSYSIIPIQFLTNFLGVLLPFEIVLINEYIKTNDPFFALLAAIFVLCEGLLFLKALINARTSIHTIILQEKLKNEVIVSSEAKKQIEYLAYHDQLTGVWNRHYIQMQLEALHRKEKVFGIILLDINYFKQINDTYGHSFGDGFLIQFVKIIQSALPNDALLGRFGGDEFIVLLPACTNIILEETKLSLKTLLAKTYTIETIEINGSTSIGTALYPKNAQNIETLIHFADKSMYADKRNDHLKND